MPAKITALEIQKHNKERVNVYLDGNFAFGLHIDRAAQLKKGQVLTEQEITELKDSDLVQQAYEKAVRYLGRRPRSAFEIRQNLRRKKIDDTVIDVVLTRLQERGYVDDLEFARYWIRNREMFRPRGVMALRAELREKGVESEVINLALEDFEVMPAAMQVARQKAKRLRGEDKPAFRHKLLGFLSRRGFSYDTAQSVVEQLIDELENSEDGDSYFNQEVNEE